VELCEQTLLKHIRKLNINKAHGHDEISVRMIKIGGKSIQNLYLLSIKIVFLKDITKKNGKWLMLSQFKKK
jgi:hypothetical protein